MRRVKWHDEMTHSSMVEAISSMDDKRPRMGCNTCHVNQREDLGQLVIALVQGKGPDINRFACSEALDVYGGVLQGRLSYLYSIQPLLEKSPR